MYKGTRKIVIPRVRLHDVGERVTPHREEGAGLLG